MFIYKVLLVELVVIILKIESAKLKLFGCFRTIRMSLTIKSLFEHKVE